MYARTKESVGKKAKTQTTKPTDHFTVPRVEFYEVGSIEIKYHTSPRHFDLLELLYIVAIWSSLWRRRASFWRVNFTGLNCRVPVGVLLICNGKEDIHVVSGDVLHTMAKACFFNLIAIFLVLAQAVGSSRVITSFLSIQGNVEPTLENRAMQDLLIQKIESAETFEDVFIIAEEVS